MKSNKTSGQTLLIIILIAAVILTVGLAVASYSITDIKISQQEEESARAFSAAEAGIEESLKIGSATSVTVGDIMAKVSEIVQGGPGIRSFDFGGLKFASGELTNVWLVEHNQAGGFDPSFPSSGKITVCWGDASQVSSANPPAIETALVYKDGTSYKVIRAGFDPKNGRTIGFGNVDSSSGTNCGNLAFAKNIDLASGTFAPLCSGGPESCQPGGVPCSPPNSRVDACHYCGSDGFTGLDFSTGGEQDWCGCTYACFGATEEYNSRCCSGEPALPQNAIPYLLRLKLLYNSDPQLLAVTSSTNDFPTQGKCYDSVAAISESGITRKVRQCHFFEAPPAIFDYVLFSNGSLVK